MSAGVRSAVVDDQRAALGLAEEWDALADRCRAGAYARPAHALTWWEHLGRGRLAIATVRRDDRLVALAPLHRRRAGPISLMRWLGHGLGTVAEALVEPGPTLSEDARLMWRAVSGRSTALDLVESRRDSPALQALITEPPKWTECRMAPRDWCPIADLAAEGLAILEGSGAKNLRRALARGERELSSTGRTFHLEVAETRAEFDLLLADIREIMDAGEAAHPRQHLLEPPYEDFVISFFRHELEAGRAAALLGRVDDAPVAFKMVFLDATTMSLWILRHHPAAADLRPGHLLFREAYRWAAARGLKRVDLLLGRSQTKDQWSTGAYETVTVRCGSRVGLETLMLLDRTVTLRHRRRP
jgi:alpha-maltose-1-phosphate synthase